MTLQTIILAYFGGQELGTRGHFDLEATLDEAHDERLTYLMTAQHMLEQLKEQLIAKIGKAPADPNLCGKEVRLGAMVGILMGMLEEVRAEINRFTLHDQS